MKNKNSSRKESPSTYDNIDQLIVDVFKAGDKDGKKGPPKLLTAHKKYLQTLTLSDKVSSTIIEKYPKLIITNDPELKVTQEIVSYVYNSSNSEAKSRVIDFFVKPISEITFLNAAQESNVLLSIIADNPMHENNVQMLFDKLNKKFDKRLEGLKQSEKNRLESITENNQQNESKTKMVSASQLNSLRNNVLAIASLWCVCFGKATESQAIISLTNLFNKELEDNQVLTKVESFLARHINSKNKKELIALVAYFTEQNERAIEAKSKAIKDFTGLKIQHGNLQTENQDLKSTLDSKNQQLAELEQKILELTQTIHDNQQDEKAHRVELKDDTGKLRFKALNLLEDDIVPQLTLSLKALDREEPKTHVAVDKIEAILDQTQEAIKWFKK